MKASIQGWIRPGTHLTPKDPFSLFVSLSLCPSVRPSVCLSYLDRCFFLGLIAVVVVMSTAFPPCTRHLQPECLSVDWSLCSPKLQHISAIQECA